MDDDRDDADNFSGDSTTGATTTPTDESMLSELPAWAMLLLFLLGSAVLVLTVRRGINRCCKTPPKALPTPTSGAVLNEMPFGESISSQNSLKMTLLEDNDNDDESESDHIVVCSRESKIK